MKKNTKTIYTFILSMFCFLFVETFMEDTVWMEPDNTKLEYSEDDSNKITWSDWIYQNKNFLIIFSSIIIITGFSFLLHTDTLDVSQLPKIEIPLLIQPVENYEVLMNSIHSCVSDPLYNMISKIVNDDSLPRTSKWIALEVLQNFIEAKQNNQFIKDPEHFKEFYGYLIDRFKKN